MLNYLADNNPWEEISGFASIGEFNRFEHWMGLQVEKGIAARVAVSEPYLAATTFQEHWFEHISSKEVWRLVEPDIPFKGVFEAVNRKPKM